MDGSAKSNPTLAEQEYRSIQRTLAGLVDHRITVILHNERVETGIVKASSGGLLTLQVETLRLIVPISAVAMIEIS